MMGNFSLANNQNIPVCLKFPTDTAAMVMKQATLEMSQKCRQNAEVEGYKG